MPVGIFISQKKLVVHAIVATTYLDYDSEAPRSSNTAVVHMLRLTPVAEHLPVDVIRRARNVPPRLPVDPAEDGEVLNNIMTRARHL